jgi:hypothetical protein
LHSATVLLGFSVVGELSGQQVDPTGNAATRSVAGTREFIAVSDNGGGTSIFWSCRLNEARDLGAVWPCD